MIYAMLRLKAIEQYFLVILFIILHKIALNGLNLYVCLIRCFEVLFHVNLLVSQFSKLVVKI